MELTVTHCFLAVHDQDAALAFYRDVLGLEVRNDVDFGGMRWLTVGTPSQPDLEIGLTRVTASLETPYGDLGVRWDLDDGDLETTLPLGVRGVLVLPGRRVDLRPGVTRHLLASR